MQILMDFNVVEIEKHTKIIWNLAWKIFQCVISFEMRICFNRKQNEYI